MHDRVEEPMLFASELLTNINGKQEFPKKLETFLKENRIKVQLNVFLSEFAMANKPPLLKDFSCIRNSEMIDVCVYSYIELDGF